MSEIEHSNRSHAILSPSSSHRWMECPPSARLNAQYEDVTSTYAQQGTDAHELCQHKVELIFGLPTEDPRPKLEYYDEPMERYTDQYQLYVSVTAERMHATDVLVEQQVDFSEWVPEGFGHCDCMMYNDTELKVIDFKYGSGVRVDAYWNPQMMCYALGAIKALNLDGIETVSMEIFQPRMHSISRFEMKKTELIDWANDILKPSAETAYKGEGKFNAGEHCRFCKAKNDCEYYKEWKRDN